MGFLGAHRLEKEGAFKLPAEDDSVSEAEHFGHGYPTFLSRKHRARQLLALGSAVAVVALLALAVADVRLRPGMTSQAAAPPQQKHFVTKHIDFYCSHALVHGCPALSLFWSPEVHEVATENVMQVGVGLLTHADRELVKEAVADKFKNVSLQLALQYPELAETLQKVTFSEADKNIVLNWVRLMSVRTVQRIGFDVALSIRQALSVKPDVIKQRIELALHASVSDLRAKRDELVPKSVLKFWGREHNWAMTLDPENVRMMEAFDGGVFFGSDIYAPKEQPPQMERVSASAGGVLEEARALLDIIKLHARSAGWNVVIPARLTSIGSHVDPGSQILSCELDMKRDGFANFMKGFVCPLKFGSQGLDALRAVDDLAKETLSGGGGDGIMLPGVVV